MASVAFSVRGSVDPCEFPSMRQSNGDRIAIRPLFVAPSAEMVAPPVVIERDASARCGIFTGLFAGLFV